LSQQNKNTATPPKKEESGSAWPWVFGISVLGIGGFGVYKYLNRETIVPKYKL
jgi:hypothetical protein